MSLGFAAQKTTGPNVELDGAPTSPETHLPQDSTPPPLPGQCPVKDAFNWIVFLQ